MSGYDSIKPLDVWQAKSWCENCPESLNQHPLLICLLLQSKSICSSNSWQCLAPHPVRGHFFQSQLKHSNQGSETKTVMPFPRIMTNALFLLLLLMMMMMMMKTSAAVLWPSWGRWQGESPALFFGIHMMSGVPESPVFVFFCRGVGVFFRLFLPALAALYLPLAEITFYN